MANTHSIIIEGHIVQEYRCKNDDCRGLLGWANIALGVLIFECPKCRQVSVFKRQYRPHGKKLIQQIQSKFLNTEGGEK